MFEQLKDYFRADRLPHIWCPGCGNGLVLKAFLMALKELEIDRNKMVIVSGIGCSSRASGYLDFNTVHTTHGRALAYATGIKFANPELKVVVMMGDGDASAIGGNHLIHAARRNIDLTAIIYNNSIYGMTGGQFSPMTPQGKYASTSPFGNIERSFDICNLAISAGATYVGRSTTYHMQILKNVIKRGIKHKGFSMVEAISGCPISYGRKNKLRTPAEMLRWQKDNAISISNVGRLSKEELQSRFLIGDLYHHNQPEYTDRYNALINRLQGREENHD